MDVDVHDADGHHVATARGVYKTGGQGGDSPWSESVDRENAALDAGPDA